ncbi:DUF2147 domain-containing protein [Sphingomonas glaciei]|uniref:DUF2147 domain-containing protein n=1 Tax=Sphingomonas glaciei TaxID=2938948 RepID=A0ABY5MTM4_9SPHN|nr:DUF2147 domain-containing protein [Sphingomonas glaciei]UUR07121.1 DUF2147 domain-containing protein [Sphingomonas glaciei]
MRTMILSLAAAATLAIPAPALAASPIEGLWTNPKKSVVVRVAPCGPAWCGEVIKANAREEAKAVKYGMDELEGERMLSGLRPAGANRWKGQVYVPKLGRKVGSTVTIASRNQMKVSGCFMGIVCKTQIWTRVG